MNKEKIKLWESIAFGILQYVFLPVLCGFLTAGILAITGLEKLGVNRFGFANFPTIRMNTATLSTYTGLTVAAGLGCILGLILSRILKFGARLGHFDFISPARSIDAMPVPSAKCFVKSIMRLIGVPAIVVLSAVTSLQIAKTGRLPGVHVDINYEVFEVTLVCIVIIATLGCLLMFLYDMALSVLFRLSRSKEAEVKELR